MKKMSLRMRLTLITVFIIIIIAVVLTISSMYNANILSIRMSGVDSYQGPPDNLRPMGENSESTNPSDGDNPESYIENGSSLGTDSQSIIVQSIQEFNTASIIYMLVIIIAAGIITYFALGYALRPVRKLSEEIAGIRENELHVRLTGYDAGDEINRLADSFNALLGRIEKVFKIQRGFASAAAHELKTPLTAIKANIDVLQMYNSPSNEEYAQLVEITKKQTDRMINLVDDLFAISMEWEYDFNDAVNFETLISDSISDLDHAIAAKNLQVSIINNTQAGMVANEPMLRRALGNVIENAVKYNKEGGSVDILVNETKTHFVISISDTGIGIAVEHLEHIFEPFYRADTSRSRKIGGSGLGLAIAKDMIERHGGEVFAEAKPDDGMKFTIVLPKII